MDKVKSVKSSAISPLSNHGEVYGRKDLRKRYAVNLRVKKRMSD